MGQGTLPEVWDRLENPPGGQDGSVNSFGGPGRVGGPSRWSKMGRGTLPEVRDGSRDPLGGLERVGRSAGRSGMGRETLPEIQNG